MSSFKKVLTLCLCAFLLILSFTIFASGVVRLPGTAPYQVAQGASHPAYLPIIARPADNRPVSGGTVIPTPTRTRTPTRTPAPTRTSTPARTPTKPSSDPILLAAGDIAKCSSAGASQTAALLAKNPASAIALLGDNSYESGSLLEFQTCYDPYWGPFKPITRPAVGNHEYLTTGAAGYFDYFGAAAHGAGGYYSYDLGAWHIVVLNSSCGQAGGCGTLSPQGKWLSADLAAHPTSCSLAYWHHPYYSSGEWGNNTFMSPLVQILYNHGVELILSGHDHDYERFAPQDLSGNLDPANGFVQIVAGTGGSNDTPWTTIQPNSLARQNTEFGILKLTLHPNSYDWKFIPVAGSFSDSGTASCH